MPLMPLIIDIIIDIDIITPLAVHYAIIIVLLHYDIIAITPPHY
jgi:hypothetical protein